MLRSLHALLRESRASVLIEFAFVLPVLMILLTGLVELSRYLLFREKLQSTATQMLDIVTSGNNVSKVSLDHLIATFDDMMKPYPIGERSIVLTQIVRPIHPLTRCTSLVAWQYPPGGGSRIGPGGAGSRPNWTDVQFRAAVGDSQLVLEIVTSYQPLLGNDYVGGMIGNLSSYVVSWGATRYGAFNFDPNSNVPVTVPCLQGANR